jgi:hypothetical protein
MRWIKKIFGLMTPLEKKEEQLILLRKKANKYEKSGKFRLVARLYHDIEILETEIVEMMTPRGPRDTLKF